MLKDAPAVGYFKSETLRVKRYMQSRTSHLISSFIKVSQQREIIKNHFVEVGWVDEQEFAPKQAQEHQDKASNLVSFEYLKPPQ